MSRTFLFLAFVPLAIGCASTDQDSEQARRQSNFAREQSRRDEMHRRIDERIDAVSGQLRREMHELVDSTVDNRRRVAGGPVVYESADGRTRAVFSSDDSVRSRLAEGAKNPFTPEVFDARRQAERGLAQPGPVRGWVTSPSKPPAGPKGPSVPKATKAPKATEPRLRLERSPDSSPTKTPATSRPSEFRRLRIVNDDGSEPKEGFQDLEFNVILDRAKQEVEQGFGGLDVSPPNADGSPSVLRYRVISDGPVEVVPADKAESRPIIRR